MIDNVNVAYQVLLSLFIWCTPDSNQAHDHSFPPDAIDPMIHPSKARPA